MRLDPASRRCWSAGEEVRLTSREFALAEFLLRRKGQVVSRTMIGDHVWDADLPPESNVVEVYIGYLRRKLGGPQPARGHRDGSRRRVPARRQPRRVSREPLPTTRRRPGVRLGVTMAASTVTTATLLLGGLLLVAFVHSAQLGAVDSALRARAADVGLAARNGTLSPTVASTGEGTSLVQVLDATGTVVASIGNIQGEAAALSPPARTRATMLFSKDDLPIADPGQPFRVLVEPVVLRTGSGWIYVATSLRPVDVAISRLREALLLGVPLLSLIVAAIIWVTVGRALRPVEAIRRRAAAIGAAELGARVPVPRGRDAVALLAVTMNEMLSRLESASDKQRRFLGDASHELKSPLTALRAQAEVALAHPDAASNPRVLHQVQQRAQRMTVLIDDLLFLAHADEDGPRAAATAVDLDEVVLQDLHRLRTSTGSQVRVTRLEALRVTGRERDLARLIGNLTDNAVEHAVDLVEVSVVAEDQYVVVTVTDDGPGVPELDKARIFERFTRLDTYRARYASGGGAGLGLAISREIAEAHGGTLAVTARESHQSGAVFTLRLPLRDQHSNSVR